MSPHERPRTVSHVPNVCVGTQGLEKTAALPDDDEHSAQL